VATVGSEGAGDGEERQDDGGEREEEGGAVYEVPQYTGAVHYKVPKTGYYCVGTYLHSLSLFKSNRPSSSSEFKSMEMNEMK
jgi:hypothetical protein